MASTLGYLSRRDSHRETTACLRSYGRAANGGDDLFGSEGEPSSLLPDGGVGRGGERMALS